MRALVNLRQTNGERRLKYTLAKSLGANYAWRSVYRDWRWNKIARRFGYYDFKTMKEALEDD